MRIESAPTPLDLARLVAGRLVADIRTKLAVQPRYCLCLAGGSTPRLLYQLLASEPYAEQLSWHRLELFLGDERCVPLDHPESNFRMVKETWLDTLPDTQQPHIHPFETDLEPELAAAKYQALIQSFFTPSGPTFDLTLLGMGDDGHTASLFPGTPALEEKTKWVTANYLPALQKYRLTLTYPTINRSNQIWLLVTGDKKRSVLSEILGDKPVKDRYPVQRIAPIHGEVTWFTDYAAWEGSLHQG